MRALKIPSVILSATFLIFSAGCGDSLIESGLPGSGNESVAPPSFALASDFPADIVIPDIDGMRSTAFIVSTSSPAGVIAIDIDANPMTLSAGFAGVVSPPGTGIPSKLVISGQNEAFLLTSDAIIYFDPASGRVLFTVNIKTPIDIDAGLKNSDGTKAQGTITPSYPSGMARIGNNLFVSTSNYIHTSAPAVAAPGTVLVFEVGNNRSIKRIGRIVTSGYNPTGLSVMGENEIVITNSGVLEIVDAAGKPKTQSIIDICDVSSLSIEASIRLGLAAASFHGVRITKDGSRGFIGSAAFGSVYEIDLANRRVLRGLNNPYIITDGADFITDVTLSVDDSFLFVASFERSAVYPLDLSKHPPVKGEPWAVGYPAGVTAENPSGANTGAGPIAVRPGSRNIDYEGADLLIMTGYPGTLVAVTTDAPAQVHIPKPDEDENKPAEKPPEEEPPVGEGPTVENDEPCNGFATAVKSVSYGAGAGFGQNKFPDVVLGPPHGGGAMAGSTDVLSLGQKGEIILDLGDCAAVDGQGSDFIVFENPFYIGGNENAPYAELGVVSVSEDGTNFVKFNCYWSGYPYEGCAGWHPVFSNINNDISPFDGDKAGGDAFNLADAGVQNARYVKIADVNGSGGAGSKGFDLDAVAIINGKKTK